MILSTKDKSNTSYFEPGITRYDSCSFYYLTFSIKHMQVIWPTEEGVKKKRFILLRKEIYMKVMLS